jgi:hypothetical protein
MKILVDVALLNQIHEALLLEPHGIDLPWTQAQAVLRARARVELRDAMKDVDVNEGSK